MNLGTINIYYINGNCKAPNLFRFIWVIKRAAQVALMVKNPPAMQERQVRSLGGEDPLEEEMAIHSSILAWEIPWTEDLAGYSPWGRKE